jgi:hypothetical protein
MATPNARTIAQLITMAKNLADMTGSTFPDDAGTANAAMFTYANTALADLHDILLETFEEYLTVKAQIPVLGSIEEYLLPDGSEYSSAKPFQKLVKAYLLYNGRRYVISPINYDELDSFQTAPITSGTVDLFYLPQMTPCTATTDIISDLIYWVPRGAEDYIAYHMAAQLLAREESDVSFVMAERERIKQRIINQAESRDYANRKVVDKHRWVRRDVMSAPAQTYFYLMRGTKICFYEVDPCLNW